MARVIKRYWWIAMLNLLMIVAAATFMGYRLLHHADRAEASPPDPGVDSLSYSRVSLLRERTALTNGDLASMGCNGTVAQQVLGSLLTWYRQNKETWDLKEAALISARTAYLDALQQARAEPEDPAAALARVVAKRQALNSAIEQWKQFLDGVVSPAQANLNGQQSDVWGRARAGLTRPLRYRYVSSLNNADLQSLRGEMARSGETSTALAELEQSLLGATGGSEITGALANLRQNIAGVCAADAAVLPRPQELRLH